MARRLHSCWWTVSRQLRSSGYCRAHWNIRWRRNGRSRSMIRYYQGRCRQKSPFHRIWTVSIFRSSPAHRAIRAWNPRSCAYWTGRSARFQNAMYQTDLLRNKYCCTATYLWENPAPNNPDQDSDAECCPSWPLRFQARRGKPTPYGAGRYRMRCPLTARIWCNHSEERCCWLHWYECYSDPRLWCFSDR